MSHTPEASVMEWICVYTPFDVLEYVAADAITLSPYPKNHTRTPEKDVGSIQLLADKPDTRRV